MPPDAKCESRKSKYVTASVASSASKAKASTLELGEGGGRCSEPPQPDQGVLGVKPLENVAFLILKIPKIA